MDSFCSGTYTAEYIIIKIRDDPVCRLFLRFVCLFVCCHTLDFVQAKNYTDGKGELQMPSSGLSHVYW